MTESAKPLKPLEVGSYAELVGRPNPQHLTIQYIPSLAAILLAAEKHKGSPLARAEVEAISDQANVMAALPDAAKAVQERRGCKDIDPSHAWEEWQVLRTQFGTTS
jgi:hypothetical protein